MYKFRFESHIRLNSYKARYKVVKVQIVQGSTSIIRFGNILTITITLKKRVKQKSNPSITIIITTISLMQITMIMTIKLTAAVII